VHDDERQALATLCKHLPRLRAEIAAHPAASRELLARIEERARADEPVVNLLAELFPAGQTGVSRGLEPLPSLGPGQASRERFRCPDGRCDREETTTPAGPLPRCWLSGRFMKLRSG
jgi:hypothetical protein